MHCHYPLHEGKNFLRPNWALKRIYVKWFSRTGLYEGIRRQFVAHLAHEYE